MTWTEAKRLTEYLRKRGWSDGEILNLIWYIIKR